MWHHSLLLMNGFNKTEAAIFSCRPCFLRAFPFHQFNCSSTDDRKRLSGMNITGDGRLIYKDLSQKLACSDPYPPKGIDVCSDVILIPLNGPSVGNLTISTGDYLTLCEVQVFGGITFLFFQASDKHTYI